MEINLPHTIEFDKIKQLQTFRLSVLSAMQTFSRQVQPMLRDFSQLEAVLIAHRELEKEIGLHNKDNVYERRKIIFVMLYLFCPRTLAGGNLVKGLRRRIGKLLGLKTYSVISSNIDGLMVLYERDKDFHDGVDILYFKTCDVLRRDMKI
jgi:hypothetical protein